MQALARITSKGIQYQNKYYTCPMAIAEQWFNQTSSYYAIEIPVRLDDDLLYIVITDSEELIPIREVGTLNKLPQHFIEEYYTKLNQLKLELKTIKNEKS